MYRSLLLFSALLLLPCLVLAADEPAGWTNLTNLTVWKGSTGGWVLAERVAVNEKNPRQLTYTEGKGILVNGKKGREKDLLTQEKYGDLELHAEFFLPKGSNSGIKFHGHYEIQICDSFGAKNLTGSECGGIYPRAELKPKYHHIDKGIPPRSNACRAPGEWQTLEAIFLAPRFDAKGQKIASARLLKVVLNGTLIHENVELATPTGHNWHNQEVSTGPLLIQGDHGPVAFRNLRIRPYKASK